MLPKRWTITGRSTEKPNEYCVVSENVWPELVTVGTVMRPMVSDIYWIKSSQSKGELLERTAMSAVDRVLGHQPRAAAGLGRGNTSTRGIAFFDGEMSK